GYVEDGAPVRTHDLVPGILISVEATLDRGVDRQRCRRGVSRHNARPYAEEVRCAHGNMRTLVHQSFTSTENGLVCDGVSIESIVERVATPVYIYSAQQ